MKEFLKDLKLLFRGHKIIVGVSMVLWIVIGFLITFFS